MPYLLRDNTSLHLIRPDRGPPTAGEGLSEHTAPFEAFVQIIDGEAEVSIAGAPHAVKTGQLLRLPAGIPHGLRAVSRFKMLLVMMKASAPAG